MSTNDALKFLEAITTPAVVSLVVSLMALFFSDRIKFGIERLRENTTHRRKLVKSWQSMLSKALKDKSFDIYESDAYISLRPYLRDSAIEKLEPFKDNHKITIVLNSKYKDGIAGDTRLLIISSEITRIQKEWKIF